jgi:hypothetical protein
MSPPEFLMNNVPQWQIQKFRELWEKTLTGSQRVMSWRRHGKTQTQEALSALQQVFRAVGSDEAISLVVEGCEVMRFEGGGRIYARGELVDDNVGVYREFLAWLHKAQRHQQGEGGPASLGALG